MTAGRMLAALAALAGGCGGGAPAFDAGIDGVYLVQSTQDYAGSVPLVQGRAGLLRVFLRAHVDGLAGPAVRVQLRDASGAVVATYDTTTQPGPATLPTTVSEESLAGSWNFAVPAADVQPGWYFVAEIDPIAGVPASRTRTTFRYPASGGLDVRAVPSVAITIVPVVQAPDGQPPLVPLVTGTEPGGSTRALDSWLDRARRIHPLLDVDVQLGATYTTATVLGADGSGWATLLSELEQKRLADGSARSYLGAAHVTYYAGSSGIAYAPSTRRPSSALVWDAGSSSTPSYQRATAHEVGHLIGLLHAPCGMPAGVDPQWPTAPAYAGAHIGVFGWDPLDGTVKDPTTVFDLMSYCGTIDTTWTSDYDFRRVLRFLTAAATGSVAPAAARQPCLVVAGRLREGKLELEPAYVVDAIPSPVSPGEYALDLLDAAGSRFASVPFAPTLIPAEREGEAEERHFALALPLAAGWAEGVRGLAVRERGAVIHRRALAAPPAAGGPPPILGHGARGHAHLSWDARSHPGAMVRDPRTGEVLAFLRGGAGLVRTDAAELEVVLSDAVDARHRVVLAP